jgi:hypothetical protein
MLFVRHRINFPLALFSISEQQLARKLPIDCAPVDATDHQSAMSPAPSDAVLVRVAATNEPPLHRNAAASVTLLHCRVLSAFGICRIAAWLAVLQTTSAFVLIVYCWSIPGYSTVHPYFGAAVMLAVLSFHLLFLLWPQRMEAGARGSLRSALKRCVMSGFAKYRLLDNVCAPGCCLKVVIFESLTCTFAGCASPSSRACDVATMPPCLASRSFLLCRCVSTCAQCKLLCSALKLACALL